MSDRPDQARCALESRYYDEATDLCDLVPLAEQGDDRMHHIHLAIMEALADAHEAGMEEGRENFRTALLAALERTAPKPAPEQVAALGVDRG